MWRRSRAECVAPLAPWIPFVPAKAGTQTSDAVLLALGPRFRGDERGWIGFDFQTAPSLHRARTALDARCSEANAPPPGFQVGPRASPPFFASRSREAERRKAPYSVLTPCGVAS